MFVAAVLRALPGEFHRVDEDESRRRVRTTGVLSGRLRRESRDVGEGSRVERDGGRRIEVRRCGGDECEYRRVWRRSPGTWATVERTWQNDDRRDPNPADTP